MVDSNLELIEKELDAFMGWVATDDKSFVTRANFILFANHMRKAIKDRDEALAELKKIKKQLEITIAESDRFEQMLYKEAGISYTLMEELEQYKRDVERYRAIESGGWELTLAIHNSRQDHSSLIVDDYISQQQTEGE